MNAILHSLVIFSSLATCFPADDEDAPKGPKKLILGPATAPEPKLRYRLLPSITELEPGNAASLYRCAFMELNDKPYAEESEKKRIQALHNKTLEELKNPKLNLSFPESLTLIDRAARKSYVDWDMIHEIRKEGSMSYAAPELGPLWTALDYLILRSRKARAEGRFDDALQHYQTELALSRHLSHGQTSVDAIMAMAISERTASEIESLIQQPNAPNLYWAIMALPRPLISLEDAIDLDNYGNERFIPQCDKLERQILSEEEAQQCFKDFSIILERFSATKEVNALSDAKVAAGKILQKMLLEQNEKVLKRAGRSEGEIKKMSSAQVYLLAALYQHRIAADEMKALSHLPYAESIPRTEKLSEDLRKRALQNASLVFSALLNMSASSRVLVEHGKVERHWAMLANIEALHLHASEKGSFPDSLKDCMLPVLPDPLTGQMFLYEKNKELVMLRSPPAPFLTEKYRSNMEYEIRLGPNGK